MSEHFDTPYIFSSIMGISNAPGFYGLLLFSFVKLVAIIGDQTRQSPTAPWAGSLGWTVTHEWYTGPFHQRRVAFGQKVSRIRPPPAGRVPGIDVMLPGLPRISAARQQCARLESLLLSLHYCNPSVESRYIARDICPDYPTGSGLPPQLRRCCHETRDDQRHHFQPQASSLTRLSGIQHVF